MDNGLRMKSIEGATLDELVKDYPNVVPEKLKHLDQQRYETIPRALAERVNDPYLTKGEVATLVDWKLSHGKFRPALKGLFQQNTEQAVLDATKDAFSGFSHTADSTKTSLNALTKMRGIGPATASLLLSVYDSRTIPFFSDELFRWAMYEDGRGKGWDREIKYNMKEYLQLLDIVHQLQGRLKRYVTALEMEKAAYVLGKHAPQTAEDDGSGARQVKKRKAPATEVDSLGTSDANQKSIGKIAKTRDAKGSSRPNRKDNSNVAASSKRRLLRKTP